MRNSKLWVGLAALGLLVTMALADNNVLNHGTYYSNAPTGLKADGTAGNLAVSEQYPAMDANLTFANIIGPSAIAAASADSSAILDTHRMRLGMLLIKAIGAGGAAATDNRLAIQIRTHLQGANDTSSVFAIYSYGATEVATAGAKPDTISFGHIVAGSTTTPWSSEIDLQIDGARAATQTGGSANDFRTPNGIAIPLQSLFGRDLYSPYTSVRVRNLAGPTCTVTVSLIGTPL